jgi:hypothetical protein
MTSENCKQTEKKITKKKWFAVSVRGVAAQDSPPATPFARWRAVSTAGLRSRVTGRMAVAGVGSL